MPVARGKKGIAQEMRKFKAGKLHSGSKHGPVVTNPKQAIAIAMSEAGMAKKKKKKYAKGGMVRGMGRATRGGSYSGCH